MPASARLPGLSGEVRVYRDAHGVPHIFAPSMNDAARALGYIHASERLYQMEIQRRAGQGRLAEIAGADLVGVDKFIRTLGFYRLATSSFSALSPEAQAYYQAYADGVNAFLVSHKGRLPPEFLILGDDPEPWRPADSLVWGKLMSLQLSHNYALEEARADLAQKMPPDMARLVFPGAPDGIADHHAAGQPFRSFRIAVGARAARRADRHRSRRLERMGDFRRTHADRQADPRQ